jgi:hypothetical protein
LSMVRECLRANLIEEQTRVIKRRRNAIGLILLPVEALELVLQASEFP